MTQDIYFLFYVAWGSDSFAPSGASSGFEADEGFDSFLAMRAPPEVGPKILQFTIESIIIDKINHRVWQRNWHWFHQHVAHKTAQFMLKVNFRKKFINY